MSLKSFINMFLYSEEAKTAIKSTQPGATFYRIRLEELIKPHQAFTAKLIPVQCDGAFTKGKAYCFCWFLIAIGNQLPVRFPYEALYHIDNLCDSTTQSKQIITNKGKTLWSH